MQQSATINGVGSRAAAASGAYKVDISRGGRIGRVSSEWFSRPDDERYLSLSALHASVRTRADRATARTVETRTLRVKASRDNAERMALIVPGRDEPVAPTHWSFGKLCSLVGAPAGYLRQLPAPLAAINMQHGLLSHRAELIKTLEVDDGRVELSAVTGPDYGRIWDHELVSAVMKIAGDGVGDTRWKVPGLLDWSTMRHNLFVEVTKDTTTLYASDRDVFLFLVDDAHPIEAGRLPNGDPDLYFRGFYCWNSEVGSKTLGMASFFLRAVCITRIARWPLLRAVAEPQHRRPSRADLDEEAAVRALPRRAAVAVALAICAIPVGVSAAAQQLALPSRPSNSAANLFAAYVMEASQRFCVPATWIRAVVQIESAGEFGATSSAGAMGLMQLMPETYAALRARLGLGANPTIRTTTSQRRRLLAGHARPLRRRRLPGRLQRWASALRSSWPTVGLCRPRRSSTWPVSVSCSE